MALKITCRNPSDGIATFDQIEFHRATSSGGTFSVVSTSTIDVSNRTDLSPGYTSYTDATGDNTKYYKTRYKNSVSSITSTLSIEFQGETTLIDSHFRRRMADTNSASYFFSKDDVEEYRKDAVHSLWPHTWQEGYDDSGTTDGTTEVFTAPAGVTRINKIQLLDDDGTVVSRLSDYEVQSNSIIFPTAPSNGYTMRLWVEKMFTKWEEVPETFDSYLIDFMMLQAYRVLEADRTRYYKYTTVQKPDNGGITNIRDIIIRLEASTERRLNALRRIRKPSEMGLQ
jgi:hypothetical protein